MASVVLAIPAAIVSEVTKYLVSPFIRPGYYSFCVRELTKNLEEERRKLTSTKDDVSQRAKEAEKEAQRIENAVKKWLQEVESLLDEVEKLEEQVEASGCFWNLFPTCRRYRLCEQLAKKIEKMAELNKNSKFEPFSRLLSLPSDRTLPNFMWFKSTESAYEQLLEAIKDDGCYMICLHGMGGCGKTTLAHVVRERAMELNLFDKVVLTAVSQTPNVRRIQGEIADQLEIRPLTEESERGRAGRISLRLQSGERILVILDDVWGMLKLQDFGIPSDGNLKGCKVLLTTRRKDLCNLMEAQRNVPLDLLSKEDAWDLFKKYACIVEDSSEFNTVAQKVAAECKGLPIAIQAVGTTLKRKPLDSWKDALYKLTHSKPVGVEKGVIDAFTCLQYSYDDLESEEAKGLFLICSIFPEDHEIEREDLFRYGIGLGLFEEVDSFEDLRSRVNATLIKLLECYLLMHCERGEDFIKMHDVVRDFALWTASKNDRAIMVDHAKGLSSLALGGAVKNCFAISSWYNGKDDQFPRQLEAPNLKILLLNSNSHLDLSHASFEGMEGLRVMALIGPLLTKINVSLPQSTQWLTNLPQSTQLLTNLRTLRLQRCELGDISFVVCLKQLEILDLMSSTFGLLPKGIEELNKLRMLDLRYCRNIENCEEVVSRCSQLEELYVNTVKGFSEKNITDSNTCFQEKVSFPKLQRYVLPIGHTKILTQLRDSSTRALHIGELNFSTLSTVIKDLIQRAEEVCLDSLPRFKSVFPELVAAVGSMNLLTKLDLHHCSEIEFLIYTTDSAQAYCFPRLVELTLFRIDNLKQVCHGPLPRDIFQNLKCVEITYCYQLNSIFPGECNLCNLKRLRIYGCPMLTSLFPMSVARTLLQLVDIEIERCSELRHIVMNEGQSDTNRGEEIFQVSESSDFMFPKLKYLRVTNCDKLEYIFPIYCAQGLKQLQIIRIQRAPQMKYVFGEHAGEDLSSSTNQNEVPIVFPQLEYLTLSNLTSLVKISSGNYYPSWPSLKSISWFNCPKLTNMGLYEIETAGCKLSSSVSEQKNLDIGTSGVANIFHFQRDDARSDQQVLTTSKLEHVTLRDLSEMSIIWTSLNLTQILSLRYLRSMKLHQCEKLKCAFPIVIHSSFPHLIDLAIHNCEVLEEIFAENEEHQNLSRVPECFPKLERLEVKGCTELKVIFSIRMTRTLPQLRTLRISRASKLKEIFRRTNEDIPNNGKEIIVPNLREIILEELPNLLDICQGFKFLTKQIDKVRIYDCPKFAPISEAACYWRTKGVRIVVVNGSSLNINAAPTLPLAFLFSKELDGCGVIDMFQIDGSTCLGGDDQQQLIGAKVVSLEHEHKLWMGPIPRKMLSLQYLHSLAVRRCGKLKSLFSMDVIHESLPELAFLSIRDCEELEEIIAEEKGEQQNVSNTQVLVCFPKLRELMVERCNKLKRLFPATIARKLPQLEVLRISKAAKLKEVFSRKSEGSVSNYREKIVLTNLEKLTLLKLPSLVGLRGEMEMPRRLETYVKDCPNSGFKEGSYTTFIE